MDQGGAGKGGEQGKAGGVKKQGAMLDQRTKFEPKDLVVLGIHKTEAEPVGMRTTVEPERVGSLGELKRWRDQVQPKS